MISGFRASDIGQYGIEDLSWWRNPSGYDRFDPNPGAGTQSPFFGPYGVLGSVGLFIDSLFTGGPDQQRTSVPLILPQLPGPEAQIPTPTPAGDQTVVPQTVDPGPLDPEYRQDYTVYEDAPGGIYQTNRPPTDWDAYYERYRVLNPDPEEETEVFDWVTEGVQDFANFGQTVGWWGGGNVQPGGPSGPVAGPPVPARVTVDTRTGKVTACKRRRRRKLLTESDFNVLLRVATLPNKENVRIVLGKAIGRS